MTESRVYGLATAGDVPLPDETVTYVYEASREEGETGHTVRLCIADSMALSRPDVPQANFIPVA